MHIAVSWDISAPQPQWSEINSRLVTALGTRAWCRPVNTFYAVRVTGEPDREAVRLAMEAVAESSLVPFKYVISPVMQGGYAGRLDNTVDWEPLNRITV